MVRKNVVFFTTVDESGDGSQPRDETDFRPQFAASSQRGVGTAKAFERLAGLVDEWGIPVLQY